ncbi:MAG: YihY/virulence factor BrkB family protein [Spirochaetaceae bacterium]|jgi:uncharacterized BrkB/YihY/UPF0761 family membrane protein|nr:YihY/virulence factor BrkB family protein [Spirochaetaceae bacterium]
MPKFEKIVQYVLITLELFNKHGLANHAAAGAYGFLFSAAPALLIVSFFVTETLESSPETSAALIGQMGLLGSVFDMRQLTVTFLGASKPGMGGLISIAGLLWTARVFTLSLQRGLGVIFPDTDKIHPVKKALVSAGIQGALILFTFIAVLTSEAAFLMYHVIGVVSTHRLIRLFAGFIPLIVLGMFIFGVYMLVPALPPKRKAAFQGAIFCLVCNILILEGSRFMFNPAKYNIIYGTLGNLFILLADVYFFFIIFFWGAELTFVIHYFDALIISRFIKNHSEIAPNKSRFERRFFMSTAGRLKTYLRTYPKGNAVFHKGDKTGEVYYILSGEAEVYLEETVMLTLIKPGNFFGEMGHLLAEGRSATIKAREELQVLVMPPDLFHEVLKNNTEADQKVIEILSQRLKDVNEKLIAAKRAVLSDSKTAEEGEP